MVDISNLAPSFLPTSSIASLPLIAIACRRCHETEVNPLPAESLKYNIAGKDGGGGVEWRDQNS